MSDRVTWLLPVRNGMPYLPETLASIEAQTYQNWEVLVWDDGSTDGTLEELKKWIPSRLPGKLFTGESLGVGGSLARLVEECETEFCARIDADDVCLPDRLEKQVAYLHAHPEIAVLGSWMFVMNSHGVQSKHLYKLPSRHDDIVHFMLRENSVAHPSVVFRRSAVLSVGNYHKISNVEDYDLWLRIAATHNYKLENLEFPLVKYRLHENSETRKAALTHRIQEATNECFYRNASLLFGCSHEEAKLLRTHQHPHTIDALHKIAVYLNQHQGGDLMNRLNSKSFIKIANDILPKKQRLSKIKFIFLKLANKNPYFHMRDQFS
jgi:glycosyltransferase involved in cell wall biosynthesis